MYVSVLVSMACAANTVLSVWRLRLSGDIEENPGPDHLDQPIDDTEKTMGATATAANTDDIVTRIMQAVQQQLQDQTIKCDQE